ncbi:MAG: helix-turn-helix domain-containing protein, partial [Chloroflexota bacterium]|nr:helix-turn-helix domain-containing protein [Chloroflexota bacterium]
RIEMRINPETLRRERMRRALTQKELAAQAGVSYVTLSRMENGSGGPVRPPTLRKIAEALDLAPDVLIDWGEDETEDTTKKLAA